VTGGMGGNLVTTKSVVNLGRSRAPAARTMATMSKWTEIGDRVFVRRYAFFDQNIGVVLGPGAAMVIDTRSSHAQAREILDDLRDLTDDPVTVVVDTHGHFDHAWGNHVFRPAPIWGHARCVTFMERTAEVRRARIATEQPELAADLPEVVIDPPDRVFDEMGNPEVGGRRVELLHLGRGHTDHDIVVRVPDANVLFAGDLLEQGAVPFFGDGYPLDWPETALRVAELSTGVVVPGHGDHGGPAFADEQAGALLQLAEVARRVHRNEMTLNDAVAATPFPAYPAEDVRRPLLRALEQLRGELD
jgi:glyoxylase-like metal-dependent hydrolase (beta-lactamase superfamily II)